MSHMRLVVASVVLLSSTVAVAKPGAIAIPPMEAELGAGTPLRDAPGASASTELRVGGSWASLYWKPTPVDFTLGYVGSFRTIVPSFEDGNVAQGPNGSVIVQNTLRLNGAYAELGYALENHRNWRTWLGLRAETMAGDYHGRSLVVVGGAVRLGAEIFTRGVGGASDHRAAAFFVGSFALGVYVEGMARTLPKELGPVGLGAGVSMRIPFIAAIGS